ncbi:FtsX-like permease family protein [Agromyces sp. ZXT2-6]|uniref:FtsX-like permease family protein n=1 Tax=Agromyces sp. ZXT2-6 TaxID=3461153 RepID=UPI004054BBFC
MTAHRSRTSAAGLLLRQWVSGPLPSIAVALLVCAAAAFAVAVPRAVAGVHTDALSERLAARPAVEIDLATTTPLGPDIGASELGTTMPDDVDAVWGGQEDRLRGIRDGLPQPLRAATEDPLVVAVSGPVRANVPGASIASPVYRIQPGFDPRLGEHVRLVEGAWPAPLPGPLAEARAAPMEIVLGAEVAADMDWAIGDVRRIDYSGIPVGVRLAGTVQAIDPGDGYWTHVPTGLRASVVDNGLAPPEYTAVGWLDPASWPDFAPLALALRMDAWIPVDADAVRAVDAPRIAAQLGELASTEKALGSGRTVAVALPDAPPGTFVPYLDVRTVGTVGFTSGLRDELVAATTDAASVDTVLATVASGPLGVTVAVLVLAAQVVFERRRTGLELAAARGASPGQLRGILLLEGLAIGIPSAVLGVAIGVALTPDADAIAGWPLAALLAATPAAVLVARAPGLSPLRRARADLGASRAGRLRVVAEALVIIAAAVSVVLLWQRGTAGAASVGVDPLLAAAPLLLALAACVLVLRLYPLPLAALVRRMSHRRDLVPFLGSARALRDPSAGLVPVLAVVVGMSVAVTSAVMLSTLEAGTDTASQRRAGSDVVVAGVPLTRAQLAEMSDAPGVEAIAPVYSARPAVLEIDGRNRPLLLIVVDRDELALVQEGRFDALALPERLSEEREAAPILVSGPVAELIDAGEDVELEGRAIDVVDTAGAQGPFTTRTAWALIDRVNSAPFVDTLVPRSVLVRLAPGGDADAVGARLAEIAGEGATATSAARLTAEIGSTPDAGGLRAGLVAAIVVATLLTALALALALLVGQAARARLLPLLATLGLGRRGERGIVAWEIAPVTAVAVVAGVLLGATVPLVVLQGVDLRSFTGGAEAPAVTYDWVLVGAVVAASVIVSAAAAAAAAHIGGRVTAARAMRKEEEG